MGAVSSRIKEAEFLKLVKRELSQLPKDLKLIIFIYCFDSKQFLNNCTDFYLLNQINIEFYLQVLKLNCNYALSHKNCFNVAFRHGNVSLARYIYFHFFKYNDKSKISNFYMQYYPDKSQLQVIQFIESRLNPVYLLFPDNYELKLYPVEYSRNFNAFNDKGIFLKSFAHPFYTGDVYGKIHLSSHIALTREAIYYGDTRETKNFIAPFCIYFTEILSIKMRVRDEAGGTGTLNIAFIRDEDPKKEIQNEELAVAGIHQILIYNLVKYLAIFYNR